MSTPYIVIEDVAERYHRSTRAIQDLVAKRAVPHLRHGGTRRVLFVPEELDAWDLGSELEVVDLPNGGRRVKPRPPSKEKDRSTV